MAEVNNSTYGPQVVVNSSPNVQMEGGGVGVQGAQAQSVLEPNADPDFYQPVVDQLVKKIAPYVSPVDYFTRQASRKVDCKSWEYEAYSVGNRPIKTKLTAQVTAQSSGTTMKLSVEDPTLFSESDTILVLGVNGYESDGTTQSDKGLMLYVFAQDTDGSPIVIAVNGKKCEATHDQRWLPQIANETELVRMGKACAELDAQTANFAIVPTPRVQYLQNFMCQVTQGTLEAMHQKNVPWNLSDIEELSLVDMRRSMELSFLLGVKKKFSHPTKKQIVHTTEGIWHQAEKDFELGSLNAKGKAVIKSDDMVDLCEYVFTGTGSGGRDKIMVAGKKIINLLSKMNNEQRRYTETTKKFDMTFESFTSFGGRLLCYHHELMDDIGFEDKAFILDAPEITKATMLSMSKNLLDLEKAGVMKANAIVLQEVSALFLRNPLSCVRVSLVEE